MSTKAAPPKPRFFATAAAFRSWLAKRHASANELVLGFWRVSSGRRGITYAEALDEALCFGWIDGVRRGLDDESWTVRFTPRKRGSLWSRVNVRHVARLEKAGRMQASGREAFAATDSVNAYSYAEDARRHALGPEFERRLAADVKAHAFWEKAAPWYKRAATKWIVTAKQDATRERRFGQLLDCSRRGDKVPPLDYPTKVPVKKCTAKKSAAAPTRARTTRKA